MQEKGSKKHFKKYVKKCGNKEFENNCTVKLKKVFILGIIECDYCGLLGCNVILFANMLAQIARNHTVTLR